MPNLAKELLIDRCPHCGVDSPNLTAQHFFNTTGRVHQKEKHWGVYVCGRCGSIVTAWAEVGGSKIQEMFPALRQVDPAIPPIAREFMKQAIDSAHAPAGAVMLCASAVDAMLKEKGYKKGWLNDRINQAKEDHLITKEMAEWAHEVRIDANDPRHADEERPLPTEEDAKKCTEFVRALGEYLFVLPARVKRGRSTPPTKGEHSSD